MVSYQDVFFLHGGVICVGHSILPTSLPFNLNDLLCGASSSHMSPKPETGKSLGTLRVGYGDKLRRYRENLVVWPNNVEAQSPGLQW
ncbi:hypothetical protein LINPERPRIM_LOCUS24647, partial [Linum perenne]